jgi:hypothetical protein
MADGKYPAHPIVGKLGEAGAIKLLGYFGTTSGGTAKIYLNLDDLSEHYLIREDDILHVADASSEELPHGGSVIWVKPDARVEYGVTYRTAAEARFLAGEIAARMARGQAVTYRTQFRQAFEPDTANCNGFSVWPCSVVLGACLASNDMPCANTKQYWCGTVIYSAQSCFTCAGYTCVAVCYSAGCPPTAKFCSGAPVTHCCQAYSQQVCGAATAIC